MTIKSKISFQMSIFFSIFFGIIAVVILLLLSEFRKTEFKDRLDEKAMNTIRLLLDVKEIDRKILKIIDKHTINKLYNEKTLIFDENFNLIYSSLDDTKVDWAESDLKFLKNNHSFFKKRNDYEVYGVFFDGRDRDFYALVSAQDSYGQNQLSYLTNVLIGSYLSFTFITWLITFYLVKRQMSTLDELHQTISQINDLNVQKELVVKPNSNNEIDLLSVEFNYMMSRIVEVYNQQRDFTLNASHELRTPLLRMSMQLENKILSNSKEYSAEEVQFFKEILKDVNQLSQMINSLLLMSRANINIDTFSEIVRIDEVLYNSIEIVSREHREIVVEFQIDKSLYNESEVFLEIKTNQNLLEIAFVNLVKNAFLYSDNNKVYIDLFKKDNLLTLEFKNSGKVLSQEDQKNLFKPFVRGKNSNNVKPPLRTSNPVPKGLGIGLTIVHKILTNSRITIEYKVEHNNNNFILTFPTSNI